MAGWVRATALFIGVAMLAGSCGTSVGRGRSGSAGAATGRIVVRFNGGLGSDSYVVFDANGQRQGSLGVPGYEFAGFTKNLGTAVVVEQGTLGSGHAQTFLNVGPTTELRKTRIWAVADDLTTLPGWSPSGSLLAFGLTAIQSPDSTGVAGAVQDGVWVISRSGQHPRLVAAGEIGGVAWSPDGSKLAYVSNDGRSTTLKVVSLGGGRPIELGSIPDGISDEPVAWSPDGQRVLIAYAMEPPGATSWNASGVEAFPVTGGSPVSVLPSQSAVIYTGVAYSPDGSAIAVSMWSKAPSQPDSATSIAGSSQISASGYQVKILRSDGASIRSFGLASNATVVGWYSG